MAIERLDDVDVSAGVGAPLSIADIAEVELAFKRRPSSSGWSGYGFVRDRASGPSAIILFFSGESSERLLLSRSVNGSYRLSRDGTRDQFTLNELKGLNRVLAWLATRG
jgi:hypothetical protein